MHFSRLSFEGVIVSSCTWFPRYKLQNVTKQNIIFYGKRQLPSLPLYRQDRQIQKDALSLQPAILLADKNCASDDAPDLVYNIVELGLGNRYN